MYSYTNFNEAPLLTIKCRQCTREFIQQEIYTCLACTQYACRFCTSIELHTYYCRNCSDTVPQIENNKYFKCQKCYLCPLCNHVLSVSKDPKSKKNIYLCQFCYWTSIQLNLMQEKPQQLIKLTQKWNRSCRQFQFKIIQNAHRFYKEKVDGQKLKESNRKKLYASENKISHLHSSHSLIKQDLIKYSTLQDNENQFVQTDQKKQKIKSDHKKQKLQLKAVLLLSRKTRRCLRCKKLLTKSFKTFKNQHKIELGHNEPKILICQKMPATDIVKLKCLKNLIIKMYEQKKQYKQNEIIAINNKKDKIPILFEVLYEIVNPNKQKKLISYIFSLKIQN